MLVVVTYVPFPIEDMVSLCRNIMSGLLPTHSTIEPTYNGIGSILADCRLMQSGLKQTTKEQQI